VKPNLVRKDRKFAINILSIIVDLDIDASDLTNVLVPIASNGDAQLFVGIHANRLSLSILVLSRTCALLNSSIYFQISLEIYKKSVFFFCAHALIELGSNDTINLEPYIYELSSNVKDYCDTFIALGVKECVDAEHLKAILRCLNSKHRQSTKTSVKPNQVMKDRKFATNILSIIVNSKSISITF
jgi:hypothetical protein